MTIEWLVFDLGNVVIDIDYLAPINYLSDVTGFSAEKVNAVFKEDFSKLLDTTNNTQPARQTSLTNLLMTGDIAYQDFLNTMSKQFEHKAQPHDIDKAIKAILLNAKQDTIQLIEKLKQHYKIACFSNTHEQHWQQLLNDYSFLHHFEKQFASHLLRIAKPEPDGFIKVAAQLDTPVEACLMIDDLPENIQGAKQAGWHGFVFTDAANLHHQLSTLGVTSNSL